MARTALAALLLLAACGVAPPAPVPDRAAAPGPDTCGRSARAGLVGQPATALERVLILDQVRVIRPGQGRDADHSAERINFDIDAAERIARVWCG